MADIWMDVDAALSEVPVNVFPLTDDTDFKSRETSVAYNADGMDLVWNFVTTAGAFTQTAVTPTTGGNYDWTHQGDGMYSIEIPASGGASINNDTEGFGWFSGVATGVLPWRGPIIGFRAAGLNNLLIDDAFSTTRGLTGTALPAAAADAAGGLPISDAGGLDLDAKLANTNEITAARMGALTDLIDGGRVDLILDSIVGYVDSLETRLTSARAAYLDNLSGGPVALNSVCSSSNISEIMNDIDAAYSSISILVSRLTSARAGYLDYLNTIYLKLPSKSYLTGTNYPDGDIDMYDAQGNFQGSVGSVYGTVTISDKTGFRLSSDGVSDIWTAGTRTLTSFGSLASDVATAVWNAGTRTITSFGSIIADIWSYATRRLTDATNITSNGGTISQTQLANLDATVSSRLSAAGYTAPDNLTISQIAGYLDTEISTILATLGTPAGASISADILGVKTVVDSISGVSEESIEALQTSLDTIYGIVNSSGVAMKDVESGLSFIHAMQAIFALTSEHQALFGAIHAFNYLKTKARIVWTKEGEMVRSVTFNFD